jgi:ubiquinone/menaquinone biosynthesis C-methylase UbiE
VLAGDFDEFGIEVGDEDLFLVVRCLGEDAAEGVGDEAATQDLRGLFAIRIGYSLEIATGTRSFLILMGIVSASKKVVPAPVWKALKTVYQSTLDLTDASSRRVDMIPPRSLQFVGGGDYKATGWEFRRLFTEMGGLLPDHKVLDVGSGIGRMAAPLTSYLSPKGEYQGFDIVKKGVDWSQNNITTRFPNFHFQHADVQNNDYNPNGRLRSSSFTFPYEDQYFDFVFLTSVFTHMFPSDVERYLAEILRVLKVGGTCFNTCFLINEESQSLIKNGKSTQPFTHRLEGCYTTTVENPESAIAYDESYFLSAVQRSGLLLQPPVYFGSWCGRPKFLSYQDIVISHKG